ncbi:MAG: hypothetical protein ACI8PQ_002478, partial [Planctomycetota bacterium]
MVVRWGLENRVRAKVLSGSLASLKVVDTRGVNRGVASGVKVVPSLNAQRVRALEARTGFSVGTAVEE